MLVSTVMPVHGYAQFLDEAVQSIISQDYSSWELLLILDRPSQELSATAEELSKLDKRIKIFSSPGSGIVDALNFGLQNAAGSLIARLDSDDLMDPQRLTKQMLAFSQNQLLGCVGSQMQLINSNGEEIGTTAYPTKSTEIRKTLQHQNCIGHPSVMFRKDWVVSAGGYRKNLTGVEDYDLWIRLSAQFDLINLSERLTKYRVSPGQYSKTFGHDYTILEDAARMDSIFRFLSNSNDVIQSPQILKKEISSIRKRNLFSHPLKVLISLRGLLVSRLIRISSTDKQRWIKLIQILPVTTGLLMISPTTLISLVQRKKNEWKR